MTTVCISGDLNLTFVHIPKTAGTSISKWLRKNAGSNPCKVYWHHPLLRNITPVGFVFSSVRNPWARLWSGYQNLSLRYNENRTDGPVDMINELVMLHGSWPTFNEWTLLLPILQSGIEPDWDLLTPQTEWLFPKIDLVLRTENLDVEFKQIQELLGSTEPLPVYNQSPLQLDYRLQYNNSSKRLVSKYFESDIDTWEYTF